MVRWGDARCGVRREWGARVLEFIWSGAGDGVARAPRWAAVWSRNLHGHGAAVRGGGGDGRGAGRVASSHTVCRRRVQGECSERGCARGRRGHAGTECGSGVAEADLAELQSCECGDTQWEQGAEQGAVSRVRALCSTRWCCCGVCAVSRSRTIGRSNKLVVSHNFRRRDPKKSPRM